MLDRNYKVLEISKGVGFLAFPNNISSVMGDCGKNARKTQEDIIRGMHLTPEARAQFEGRCSATLCNGHTLKHHPFICLQGRTGYQTWMIRNILVSKISSIVSFLCAANA